MSRQTIVEAMARTLHVDNWARREEERGRTYPGMDLMDVAPKTPRAAEHAARQLATRIEELNGQTLERLYRRAVTARGIHREEPTQRLFGHYLAMESLGHGVSWFDDHPTFKLKLPNATYYAGRIDL